MDRDEAQSLLALVDDPAQSDDALATLLDWSHWARPAQMPPAGDWRIWLLLAGRGFGKTRCGAEFIRGQIECGAVMRVALVAPTAADARDVMVEGESGLLRIAPPQCRPVFEPTKRRLTWPNGAIATMFSADEPERLRGPQFDAAWCDELAAWRYPEAWDMLMMGLRLGDRPRVVVTTTPKPARLLRDVMAQKDCVVTRGSTRDNSANLAPGFLAAVLRQYEGTRLGRQELDAEILDDMPGALWTRTAIEASRVAVVPPLRRVVVAIDPAVSVGENSDETGIVVVGLGGDQQAYVLDDLSGRFHPQEWASRAVAAYHAHRADRIVAEVNNGGAMVQATLRTVDPTIAYKPVHAARGKIARAEPVAALYEQGRVHHRGAFPALEDQMCIFTGDPAARTAPREKSGSPDRVDALVWAVSDLMIENFEPAIMDYYRGLTAT